MNIIPKNEVIHTNRNKNSGWYMISVDEYPHGEWDVLRALPWHGQRAGEASGGSINVCCRLNPYERIRVEAIRRALRCAGYDARATSRRPCDQVGAGGAPWEPGMSKNIRSKWLQSNQRLTYTQYEYRCQRHQRSSSNNYDPGNSRGGPGS